MDFTSIVSYFENIATQNKAISHLPISKQRFFEGDPDEFLTRSNADLPADQPILLLEPFILRTNSENVEYLPDIWEVSFMVLMKFNRNEQEYAKQLLLYNTCIKICKAIRNRIFLDRLNFNMQSNDMIRHFLPGSATITKVDMAKGNSYLGARCELELQTEGDDYDTDEWHDENPYDN